MDHCHHLWELCLGYISTAHSVNTRPPKTFRTDNLPIYLKVCPGLQGSPSIPWLERVLAIKATEVEAVIVVKATRGQLRPVKALALIDSAVVVGIGGIGEAWLVTPACRCSLLREQGRGHKPCSQCGLHGDYQNQYWMCSAVMYRNE